MKVWWPLIGEKNNEWLKLRRVLSLLELFQLVVLLSASLVSVVSGFNVDTTSVVSHRGPSGSMFGFSVAQHRDSNVSWILVGAPEADSRQSGVKKGGAVFRCSCETSDTCEFVAFDRTGNNVVQNSAIDEKSNQWFGATVKSSGEDGIILACAPRYTWFTSNRKRRDPVGTCYVAKDSFTEFVEYSPCRTTKWGYHRQGSCQVGLGADVDPAGRRIFLGAVGSWYWQGQMFMVDSRKAGPGGGRAPSYQFVPPGQLYSQSSTLRPDIRSTQEGPSWDDDSYLGYSVATGEFSGDHDSDVAVGMPRGANLTGKVVIFSSELGHLYNITGEQMGSYFGYSLCVLDVDGDGMDDIVIGAPMYTDYEDTAMKIETGRVYVVYQTKVRGKHKFKRWDSLDGTAHRGRFGLSLTSLGDINRDGIDDFAVGAPYDGLYGRGAVYIFQGTQDGVRKEFTQVIHGSSLQHPVNTFGFSIAGGRDLDGNGYPDLLVGAYESDVVALFRSRPVVRVRTKLTFTSGKQINLDEKNCTLRDGKTRVACFPLSLCMSYDGFGADDVIDFDVQYLLDSKKTKEHRMFFLNNEGVHSWNSTIRLRKGVEECSNKQVYIRALIRDKLTALEAELRYSMMESRQRHLSPVIDLTGSTTERDSVSIRKDCGPDNVCVPDLRLRVSQSDAAFVMGSTERIWIEMEVKNNGEDSFESMLYIQVPQGLSYVSADPLDTRKDVPILCSAPSPSTNNTIRCDIGNPLPAFAEAKFRVYFQTRHGTEVKKSYEFKISVNSTNPEESVRTGDNIGRIFMPITVRTELKVFGSSKPQPVTYNVSSYEGQVKANESHIGPEVLHTYEVKCLGPSSIEEASVTILWPSFTADGEHFLYLLEEPTIDGPATCEPINTVNPLGIKIQKHTKYFTHSVDTNVHDGEGRGRNFSSSSEYSTDGGVYTQTFQNSSYETRRTSTISGGSRGGSSGQFAGGSSGHSGFSGGGAGSRGTFVSEEEFSLNGNRGGSGTSSWSTSGRTQAGRGGGSTATGFNTSHTISRGSFDTTPRGSGFEITRGGSASDFEHRGSSGGTIGIGGDFISEETTSFRGEAHEGRGGGGSATYVPRYGERGYTGGERQGQGQNYGSTTVEDRFSGSGNGRTDGHRKYVYVPNSAREDQFATSGINQGRSTTNGRESFSGGSSSQGGSFSGGSSSHGGSFSGGSSSHGGSFSGHGGGSTSTGHGGSGTYTTRSETWRESTVTSNGRSHGEEGGRHSTTNGRRRGGERDDDGSEENFLDRHRRSPSDDVVPCGNAKCTRIRCRIGPLSSDAGVTFYLRGRVYADTLQKKFAGESVELSSKLMTKVTQLPNNVSPDIIEAKELSLTTTVEEQLAITEQYYTPWWVYLVAAIVGILLLLLIIYLLALCGFFKRRRPNQGPEGQPLHRNGYQERM